MAERSSPAVAPAQGEITITRVFDAPRELVFRAFVEPEQIVRWMAAKDWTTPSAETDVRPGGAFRIHMRPADGSNDGFFLDGVYDEVVEPDRLVFHYADGRPVTITLVDLDAKTKLTMTWVMAMSEAQERQGYGEMLDKLAALTEKEKNNMATKASSATAFTTPGDREIMITRVFDAPREVVFKAYSDPKLIPQWWGPASLKTTVDKMDRRPGGLWRFTQRAPDGNEYAFNGVYREIVPPERVVSTFEFEAMPGHVVVDTVTFEDLDGRTRVTVRSLFQTAADRDGMLQSGMEVGARESWERMAELLRSIVASPTGDASRSGSNGRNR